MPLIEQKIKKQIALAKKRQHKKDVLERQKERKKRAREKEREKKREIRERQKEKLRQKKQILREKLREQKRIEKERVAEENKRERERIAAEKKREKERMAAKMKRKKEKIAAKKKREKEIIAEEKKRMKQRILEEKKREKEIREKQKSLKEKKEKMCASNVEKEGKNEILEEEQLKVFGATVEKWERIALENEMEWKKKEEMQKMESNNGKEELDKIKDNKIQSEKMETVKLVMKKVEDIKVEKEDQTNGVANKNLKKYDYDSDDTVCYEPVDLPAPPDHVIKRRPSDLSIDGSNGVLSPLNDNDKLLLNSDEEVGSDLEVVNKEVDIVEISSDDEDNVKSNNKNLVGDIEDNLYDNKIKDKELDAVININKAQQISNTVEQKTLSTVKIDNNGVAVNKDDTNGKSNEKQSVSSDAKPNENTDKPDPEVKQNFAKNDEAIEITEEIAQQYKFCDWDDLEPGFRSRLVAYYEANGMKCPWTMFNAYMQAVRKKVERSRQKKMNMTAPTPPVLTAPVKPDKNSKKVSQGAPTTAVQGAPMKPDKDSNRATQGPSNTPGNRALKMPYSDQVSPRPANPPVKRARKKSDASEASSSSRTDNDVMNDVNKKMRGDASADQTATKKVRILNALEADEDYSVAEVYNNYEPRKLRLGRPHPDLVVETASLASVEPTDITYSLSLPADTIELGKLSALQLEAIVYSSQAHEQKLSNGSCAGFLIGDGAGVGKGRTVAGVIYENYLRGRRKSVWVSVSNDLKLDAERDLRDIGARDIQVYSLISFDSNNIYSMARVKEGVMFLTYSALSSRGSAGGPSRLEQLIQWCEDGGQFEGVIVLDECHKAKNLCPPGGKGKPTKTGLNVLKLQERLPRARLVYASATGASEPKNMAYMARLGLWGQGTAFDSFSDFIKVVEKGGVGAMEIVAMDMKLRGMYIARQLSFRGVSFHIEEVPLENSLMNVYNDSVELWVEAKKEFDRAFDISGVDPKMKRFMWAQFWGAHQRFFKYLCIAAKVDRAVAIALQAVTDGKCAVIGLQSTGEARTLVQLGQQTEELTEFLSTAEGVFKNLVETQFPGAKIRPRIPAAAAQLDRMRHALLAKVEKLGQRLPRNMLDDLVDKLGGAEKVAEMTGRKGRLVKTTDEGQQQVHYESRCDGEGTLDSLNVLEKQRFMDGDKLVAVISEAASSGVSLQSDRRVANQRRRVHITLELPWSADRAIQQFGRTHRCNQVNAPEYVFLISDLAGERRFASTVAKRLESLGALTHGDRRATETRDLSQFNIDNKYGKEALLSLLQALRGGLQRVPAPDGEFVRLSRGALEDVGVIDPDDGAYAIVDQSCNISKFLNRILGVPVKMQNSLFKYFVDHLAMVTEEAKRKGSFDQGIVDVRGARCVSRLRVLRPHATGLAPVLLHTVLVDRGMEWESALRKYSAERGAFYVARQGCGQRRNILLYLSDRGQVYRPGTGLQRAEPLSDIERKYVRLSDADSLRQAETLWSRNHRDANTVCSHAFFRTCQPGCKWGLRERKYYVLAGSVLCVWDKLEFTRLQVVRVRTVGGDRVVGTLIPASCVEAIENSLKMDAVSVETKHY